MGRDIRSRMSRKHEEDVQELLGGRQTRGSGNQWSNPMDGRHSHHDESYAFAWDCKATLTDTCSVSATTWAKACEQAGTERPCVPLRTYTNERLDVGMDLVALSIHDFAELLEAARKFKAMEAHVEAVLDGSHAYFTTYGDGPEDLLARDLRMIARS